MLRPVLITCSISVDVYPISLSYQASKPLFSILKSYHIFLELETSQLILHKAQVSMRCANKLVVSSSVFKKHLWHYNTIPSETSSGNANMPQEKANVNTPVQQLQSNLLFLIQSLLSSNQILQ